MKAGRISLFSPLPSHFTLHPSYFILHTSYFILIFLFLWPHFAYATEQVCRICHNEATLSTSRPCPQWQKHAHPVYVVPSRQITIPDIYPLNEKGELFCGTCHMLYVEPGSQNREEGPGGQVFLRGENNNSSMCKRCHAPKLAAQLELGGTAKYDKILDENFQPSVTDKFDIGDRTFYNHPVDVISPRMPRQIEENGGKPGVLKDQIICQSCHKIHQTSSRALLITDNSRSELCGFCHAPMFGLSREETAKKKTHPVNVIPSTSMLSRVVTLQGGRLGKKRQIICLTCHSIHRAKVKQGLLVEPNDRSSLCFKCHDNIQDSLTGTWHDLSFSAPQARNILDQTVEEGGLCSSCHVVHNGKGAKMWARPIDKKTEKLDTISQLCRTCHAPGEIAEKKQTGRFTHPTGVSISRVDNRYVRLPLFSPLGAPLGKGNVTCATCHNVHRWSDNPTSDKTQQGDYTNSFLRVSNSRLCDECHLIQTTIQGTSHDLGLPIYSRSFAPQLLKENKAGGESEQGKKRGTCQHCHVVHNAVSVKLWARQVGPGEDPISKICNSCHYDGMVAENKQVGSYSHAVNITIQKLGKQSSTDLPLFTDNLNRDQAGKIFCNTCHNIHQWDPKVPRKGQGKIVEGTSQNSFLRKAANDPQDPLCESCHEEVGLVRDTEHDLRISAPQEKNPQGTTADQSGVCSSCHAVHNAVHPYFLWSKNLGMGTDFISRACNSCHSDNGCAAQKSIGRYSHPVDISTFSVLDNVESTPLPIFTSSFRRVGAETVSSLSPLHIDSLKIQQTVITQDTQQQKDWLDFLKKRYIETRREKNSVKEKIKQLLKIKQELKVRIETGKLRIKELIHQIADDNTLYQEKYEQAAAEKQQTILLKNRIQDMEHEIERLQQSLSRGGPPTASPGSPQPEVTGNPPDSGNTASTANKTPEQKKEDEFKNQLQRLEEDKKRVYTALTDSEENITQLTSQYKRLTKNLKENNTGQKKLKKKYKRLLKRFKTIGIKQHKLKKSFQNLQKKLADILDEIEEISPGSFIHLQNSQQDILARISLMDELDMDFRRKFLDLKDEYAFSTESYDQMQTRYSELRLKYKDILLYPNKKRKISLLEFEDLVIEGLAEDLERDKDVEPQGKIFCSSCHNVHRWDPDKKETGPGQMVEGDGSNSFLRIPNDNGFSLCIACHKNKELVEGTKHDLAISAPREKNSLEQTPKKAGLCGNCHLVHNAANGLYLWAKKIDREVVDKLLQYRNDLKRNKKIVKNKRIEFREARKVYDEHYRKYTRRNKSGGKIKKRREKILHRLKKAENAMKTAPFERQHGLQKKITGYKKQLQFLKTIMGNSDKNNQNIKNAVGKVYGKLKNIKTAIEAAMGKVKVLKGEITALEEEFRRIPWDSMSLLCRTCHQEGKCAQTKQVPRFNHPLNVEVVFDETGPEVPDKPRKENDKDKERILRLYPYPFFTREGERSFEEGQVFCPTCHDVHKWNPTGHAKGDGQLHEGDMRNSFLRLESSPAPKLCSGCHPKQARLIGTDHDLTISAPDSLNALKQTVNESGTCGVCHIIHSANGENKLWVGHSGPVRLAGWNQDWAGKQDRSIRLCTGCHNPQGAASSKAPQAGLHPNASGYMQLEVKNVLANPQYPYMDYLYKGVQRTLGIRNIREGAAARITLFDEQGIHSPQGNITCMTCHDPHIWNNTGETPKKTVEGDVTDSFLKKEIASQFCSDCHGANSLYNYAFYHVPRNRHEKIPPKTISNPHWKKKMDDSSCTSDRCHDNLVHGALHPMGIKIDAENDRFKIPEKLPLVDKKIVCITCHNPKLQTKTFAFLRQQNQFFIRGIYEELLKKKAKGKKPEKIAAGPPKIAGLMAGPGSLGFTGGPGGMFGRGAGNKKKPPKKQKKAKRLKSLLKVRWNRYQICYHCHIQAKYKQFSPHQNQLDDKGKINREVCLVCHSKVPNPEIIAEANFFLTEPIQNMCRNCHTGYESQHPMGKDHFGKQVSANLVQKASTAVGAMATFIPLDKQKLVCSSCHNPHAAGVIQVPFAAKGAGNRARLRLTGQMRCSFCHQAAERAPDKEIHYAPF